MTLSGGGVYVNVGGTLRNCIISGNGATDGGGVYAGASAQVSLRNTVVFGNTAAAAGGSNWSVSAGATLAVTNSCTAPTNDLAGSGIVASDPQFADAAGGVYRLTGGSPCINSGTNQDWMTSAVDLSDKRRIRYDRVDMGAYEWYPNLKINGIPAGDWKYVNGVVPKKVCGLIP